MLNEISFKILFALDKMCDKGYYTLDKCDIFAKLGENFDDKENFDKHLKQLSEDKFIILKYLDENECCLLVTEEARKVVTTILQEKAKQKEQENKKTKRQNLKSAKKMSAISFIHREHSFENVSEELLPKEVAKKDEIILQKHFGGKLKTFLWGLLGGVLGGCISGAIFMIISIFI